MECLNCGKYMNQNYIIDGTCAHCWGFCFSSQLDIENFNYTGTQSKDMIKDFLKKIMRKQKREAWLQLNLKV